MEKNVSHLYFPNLNAVRAIAALMVIIFHIELIKSEFNLNNKLNLVSIGGDLGVILFFVLSGFLITFLLLKEKDVKGDISLKNFYIRRILRIWPLYLLVVILCLFLFPYLNILNEPKLSSNLSRSSQITLYFLFMANVLTGFGSHVNYARPTWSVSVEEQFYLIWPLLIKTAINPVKRVFTVFGIYWLLKLVFILLNTNSISNVLHLPKYFENILITLNYTPFDSLSIGALSAYLLHDKNEFLRIIFHKKFQLILFLAFPISIYLFRSNFILQGITEINLNNTVYGIFFAILILNLAGNKNVILNLENKVLSFLGKISFGLYLYHWFIVVISINIICNYFYFSINHYLLFNFCLYAMSLGLTILVSTISYYFFELNFLNLKQKYSNIISGDFAKKNQ